MQQLTSLSSTGGRIFLKIQVEQILNSIMYAPSLKRREEGKREMAVEGSQLLEESILTLGKAQQSPLHHEVYGESQK